MLREPGEITLSRATPVATLTVLGGGAVAVAIASLTLMRLGGVVAALSGILLAVALVLATIAVSVRLRAQVGARLRWDDWGVFEHEGALVRTAIAWSAARVHVERADDGAIDVLQIHDGRRAITMAVPGIPLPDWMHRRPTLSPALDEVPIAGLPRAPFVLDARDALRPDAPWLADRAVGPLAAVYALVAWAWSGMPAAIAVLVVAIALSALPALVELARTARATLAIRGARPIRLLRRERAIVCATDREGAPIRIDARTLGGSDASLVVRPRGTVFAELRHPARDDGPYRDGTGAALVAGAVETWCDRIRRRSRLLASAIETGLRAGAIALVIVLGT